MKLWKFSEAYRRSTLKMFPKSIANPLKLAEVFTPFQELFEASKKKHFASIFLDAQ